MWTGDLYSPIWICPKWQMFAHFYVDCLAYLKYEAIYFTYLGNESVISDITAIITAAVTRITAFDLKAVWPDLAKFHHFGKYLKIFGNIFKVYLVLGKVFNSLWHNLYAIGHIFIAKMAYYWKHNFVIWSHCLKALTTLQLAIKYLVDGVKSPFVITPSSSAAAVEAAKLMHELTHVCLSRKNILMSCSRNEQPITVYRRFGIADYATIVV